MKNWLRVTICVILVVSVLAMSLSVFADNEPEPSPTVPPALNPENPVTLSADMASLYVWKILNTWGLEVTASDWLNGTEDVLAWTKQIMIDYAADLGITVGQLIAPWLFNVDIWGNLMANDRAVKDIESLAEWIIAKFNIQDNDRVQVSYSETSINGVSLYKISTIVSWDHSSNRAEDFDPLYLYTTRAGANPNDDYYYYVSFAFESASRVNYTNAFVLFRQEQEGRPYYIDVISTIPYEVDKFDNSTTGITRWGQLEQYRASDWWNGTIVWDDIEDSNWYVWEYPAGTFSDSQYSEYVPIRLNEFFGTYEELKTFLINGTLEEDNAIFIDSSVILLPSDDPDYTDGDSITIIGEDNEYRIIDWDGTVQVSNLPAIVSTSTIENPHLEEAYRPIQGLITYAKDGVEVCTSLLYELPDELVYLWYGVIASIVIWGMIKLMREH